MTTTTDYFSLPSVKQAVQKQLGEPDFTTLLFGLGFEYRKTKTGDVYIIDGRVRIRTGGEGDFAYVLTPGSIKALEKRLGAEFRTLKIGDWYLGKGSCSWVECNRVPEPVMPHFVRDPKFVAELTYTEASKAWLAATGIKVGDKVEVFDKAESWKKGWQNSWVDGMEVGRVDKVTRISHTQGIDVGDYGYPYFCVRKYVEPAKAPEEPKKERRKLQVGVPVQPGDFITPDHRMTTTQSYKDDSPRIVGEGISSYWRDPWTAEQYKSRQEDWIKFYNLVPGNHVKVCAIAENRQDGWGSCWNRSMDELVGKTFPISSFGSHGVRIRTPDDAVWSLPFHVLQPAQERTLKPSAAIAAAQEPVYRAFKTPAEVSDWVKAHGTKIVGDDYWIDVTQAYTSLGLVLVNGSLSMNSTKYKSDKDGTPFGVKV